MGAALTEIKEQISSRQFGRQMRGESKDAIIPPETVRDPCEASLIEKETADMWYDSARQVYRFKNTKKTAQGGQIEM